MDNAMEEVLEQFGNTKFYSEEQNKTEYEGLYKNWGKLNFQDQRRRDILEMQKSNRNSNLDNFRGIMNFMEANGYNDIFTDEKLQKYSYRPSIYVAGFTKTSENYRKVLMMSEWLVEKPADFEENWFVVPCPKGIRTLLVACYGKTKLFSKFGHFRTCVSTALPGGNSQDIKSSSKCVILDCFHIPNLNLVFILDILAWNSQPMADGEAEFRHFWLLNYIENNPELKTISKKNNLIFHVLPKIDCQKESFEKFMMTFPHFKDFTPELDGLLFYHKQAHYVSGETPLVGWLFPYMVNEVLGEDVMVNPAYLALKPLNYTNQADFIKWFNVKIKRKYPKQLREAHMETDEEVIREKKIVGVETRNKRRQSWKTEETIDEATDPQKTEPESSMDVASRSFADSPHGFNPFLSKIPPISPYISSNNDVVE